MGVAIKCVPTKLRVSARFNYASHHVGPLTVISILRGEFCAKYYFLLDALVNISLCHINTRLCYFVSHLWPPSCEANHFSVYILILLAEIERSDLCQTLNWLQKFIEWYLKHSTDRIPFWIGDKSRTQGQTRACKSWNSLSQIYLELAMETGSERHEAKLCDSESFENGSARRQCDWSARVCRRDSRRPYPCGHFRERRITTWPGTALSLHFAAGDIVEGAVIETED